MLKLVEIEKDYPNTRALDGVSFNVEAGQIMALLARNGAGKSTLVSIVAGLLQTDSGEVWINGEQRIGKKLSSANQRRIGIAGQETGIYPELTVADNLRFFAQLYGVPRREQQMRMQEVAALLGLGDLLDRRGNQLSGGEKRRLHTGAALMHKPSLLLLDEPTVGADPQARNEILDAVKALANDGTAVIYTSHYFPEIEVLGADITVMHKGRLLEQGTQQELLQRHGDTSVIIEFGAEVASQAARQLYPQQGATDAESFCPTPNRLRLDRSLAVLPLPRLMELLGGLSDSIVNLERQTANLEQAFLSITQRGH
ncbi:linearmycin resistance ATP-binding protein LnrL [Maricurvus nonylphenolicus]|uniref:ABC transporter ATP-binding protein n=1 Tax=Maricurvus nonylphenolicus TaxID=1008307 RepID=UPI0036F3FECB